MKKIFSLSLLIISVLCAAGQTTKPLVYTGTPANDNIIQRKSGAWALRTPAQLKTDLSLTKSDVGLSNVVNVDTATANAQTWVALLARQPLDADLTTIAGLSTGANDVIMQVKSNAWTVRTPAQVKTDLALTKSDVGLSSVVNVDTATINSAGNTAINGIYSQIDNLVPAGARQAYGAGRANSAALDFWGTTISATGTLTAVAPANTDYFAQAERVRYISTTTTTNSQAGVRNNLLHHSLQRGFNWFLVGGYSHASTIAGLRGVAGYIGTTAGLFTTASEPSAQTNSAFFGFDAGESQFTFMHNDGSGTCTKETLNGGTGFPTNTINADLYYFNIKTVAGSNSIYYQIINLSTGVEAHGTVTTDIPTSTSLMGWQFGVNSGTTTGIAPSVDFSYMRYFAP